MLCPQDQLVAKGPGCSMGVIAHVHFRDNVLDLFGLLENKPPPPTLTFAGWSWFFALSIYQASISLFQRNILFVFALVEPFSWRIFNALLGPTKPAGYVLPRVPRQPLRYGWYHNSPWSKFNNHAWCQLANCNLNNERIEWVKSTSKIVISWTISNFFSGLIEVNFVYSLQFGFFWWIHGRLGECMSQWNFFKKTSRSFKFSRSFEGFFSPGWQFQIYCIYLLSSEILVTKIRNSQRFWARFWSEKSMIRKTVVNHVGAPQCTNGGLFWPLNCWRIWSFWTS